MNSRKASARWRRYTNARTGDVVSVLLVCGRPGPMAAHTPDVCYGGAGYEMVGQPVRRTYRPTDAGPAEFWTARFHKPSDPLGGQLRIYWSWNARGDWEAADNARLAFAGAGALYKIYVICEASAAGAAPEDDDPGKPFLDLALPSLEKALFPKAGPGSP
jgi:hypothetical protein